MNQNLSYEHDFFTWDRKSNQGTTNDFSYVCIGFGKNQQQISNHDVSVVYLIAMQKLVCTSVAIQLN